MLDRHCCDAAPIQSFTLSCYALLSGCLVRYLDFMDAYLRPDEVNHPCDDIMAILAAAEHMGGSGEDFVTAVAIAYEIQKRLLDLPHHAGPTSIMRRHWLSR